MDNLPRPDVGSLDREKNLALIGCNRAHQNVVDDGAEHCSHDLDREGTSWAKLAVLTKLQIFDQEQSLRLSIGSEEDKVHVSDWLARMKIATDELN